MSPPTHLLSGTATGKPPPEKSKFLQTCNGLSLFLKENSNIRYLNFVNAKFDATGVLETEARTIDLLSSIDDDSGEKSAPEYVILDSSCGVDNPTNKASSSSKPVKRLKTAQMTIFYGGQVVVLDDVSADRARDLMLIAKSGQPQPQVQVNEKSELASKNKFKSVGGQGEKDSDLPIARRASLHKFLAKRKDRATVRAPYQVHNQSPGGSSFGNDHSFDLNM